MTKPDADHGTALPALRRPDRRRKKLEKLKKVLALPKQIDY